MIKYKLFVVLGLAAMLTACPKPATTPLDGGPDAVPSETSGTETGGIGTDGVFGGRELPGPDTGKGGPGQGGPQAQERIVYFDYDRSDIRAEFRAMLTAHARYLAANPGSAVRLEGHTDERGSREYNIGLGERRAQAVRRALTLQGVAAGQVATVSFGEERPASLGHDESAWQQNRRVEIVYVR